MRAVIFDLDGVIFNTEELYPLKNAEFEKRHGVAISPELLRSIMGRTLVDVYRTMKESLNLPESIEELSAEGDALDRAIYRDHLALRPGVRECLAFLEQKNIVHSIATSRYRSMVDFLFAQIPLPGFAFILTGDDVTRGKPDPEIYEKAIGMLGLAPRECLVIEDSENGVKAAKAAGASVVAFPHSRSDGQNLALADFAISRLDDPKLFEFITA